MCFHISYISGRDMNAKQSCKGKIAISYKEHQRAMLSQVMGPIHTAWMLLVLSLCAIFLNLAWLIVSFASGMLRFFTFLGCFCCLVVVFPAYIFVCFSLQKSSCDLYVFLPYLLACLSVLPGCAIWMVCEDWRKSQVWEFALTKSQVDLLGLCFGFFISNKISTDGMNLRSVIIHTPASLLQQLTFLELLTKVCTGFVHRKICKGKLENRIFYFE